MEEHATALAKKGMDVNVGITKRPIHGVLKCLECNTSGARSKEGPQRHWHRYVNAAINIGKIYSCLAETGKRPYYLELPARLRRGSVRIRSSLNEGAFFKPSVWNAHT